MSGVRALARCLALGVLALPLAACGWFPFQASGPPVASHHGHVFACSMQLVAISDTPSEPRHVGGPLLTPSATKRAFAGAGLRLQPLPLNGFPRGIGPHQQAVFSFAGWGPPSGKVTSGTVTVYRTAADAFVVRRAYGPHQPGECNTYLRVGNVLISHTGPMDGSLIEAVKRLRGR